MRKIRFISSLLTVILIVYIVFPCFSFCIDKEIDNTTESETINNIEYSENEENKTTETLEDEEEIEKQEENNTVVQNIDTNENINNKTIIQNNQSTELNENVIESNSENNNEENIDTNSIGVEYYSHVQDRGWEKEFNYKNGEQSGTTGRNLKVEAMKIRLINSPNGSSIRYRAYIQSKGWQTIQKNGEMIGTTGQNRRIEAIRIDLLGLEEYSVKYRAHVQDKGWLEWCYDGDIAGVIEEKLKIEAIQIEIVPKEIKIPTVKYRSHVQDRGWEKVYKTDGIQSGTMGRNLKVEAMQIQVNNLGSLDGHVRTMTYLEGLGWQNWKYDGEITGTTGQNRKIFSIKIKLEGIDGYSIKYRVHVQDIGWTSWKADGSSIGAPVINKKKIEAIEIKIDRTENIEDNIHVEYYSKIQDFGWENEYYYQDGEVSGIIGRNKKIENFKVRMINAPEGATLKYRAFVEGTGWQDWSNNSEIAGTNTGKRIYAIRLELDGLDNYSIQYSVHLQDIGWQEWKSDGATAGAIRGGKKIEAFLIRIVPKIDSKVPFLEFNSYVHDKGWEEEFINQSGETTGLPGQGKKIESIKIRLKNAPENASVKYKLHLSDIGWTDWYSDGEEAGTPDSGKKIEAIQVKLVNMNKYTVEYKSYIQGLGWQGLRQDGKSSGTTGKNLRVEGIMIDLVGKYKSDFKGIDISKHNGTIDFGSLITNNNLDFMIIRAGYGRHSYQKDEQFERNYELAKAYGIPVGVYLYSYATDIEGARLEAQNMLGFISGKSFELPVFYDIEDPTQTGDESVATRNTQMCNEFCSIIARAGYKPGIYSGKYFTKNYLNVNALSSNCALWIASYGDKTDGTMPDASYMYKEYHDIWQYSSTGRIAGIEGNVDLNICFNATFFGKN